MDFDIDAVLDQLEKTLNQSDLEENKTNEVFQTSPLTTTNTITTKKPVDDLLLLDLDPLGSIENNNFNNNNEENNEDRLERLKQDLQELYASSTVIDSIPITEQIPTLPDIIDQQDELSLPLAVKQLELEVQREILQHTLEEPTQSSSPPPLPLSSSPLLVSDLTTLPNDNSDDQKENVFFSTSFEEEEEEEEEQKEENISSIPVIEEIEQTSNNLIFQNESDLIPSETSSTQNTSILHSVDSIVNAPMASNFEDYFTANPSTIDIEPLQTSTELLFTACDDSNQESIQSLSDEPITKSPIPSPPPSPSTNIITTAPTQDFDLVKNILSEIFDKQDEEILDEKSTEEIFNENLTEEKETELIEIEQQEFPPIQSPPITTNNEEDFRFLDEMLASIDVSDADIHRLNPAEIDRVDSLLKQIVSAHQTEETAPLPRPSSPPPPSTTIEDEPSSSTTERPPSPVSESSIELSQPTSGAASAIPIDEELVRVEQEWSKLTEEEKRLGSVAPEWVSDDLAPTCMKCGLKFSITRRRHHCRACGKVFCSACCWQKVKLIHDDSKEDRACNDCVRTITTVEYLWNYMRNNQKPRSSVLRKKPVCICC